MFKKLVAILFLMTALAVSFIALNTLRKYSIHEESQQLGKVATELSGADLYGNKLSLSQYRGKVVLLSFFGNW